MKPPPTFDHSFLRELAGSVVLKAGERLFESQAVEWARWESPVLIGRVKGVQADDELKLNLRSTVFAENRCTCGEGRKRKVCAHAVAVALHYEALKHGSTVVEESVAAEESAHFEELQVEADVPVKLRSIKTEPNGLRLRMLVFLPPNLEAGAKSDAIMVKIEGAAGREVLPLKNLSPNKAYAINEAQKKALLMIEAWCGGQLASLIQLTRGQLRSLLAGLVDEPVVYWLKKPSEPIVWSAGQLAGVHEHLALREDEEESIDAFDQPPASGPAEEEGKDADSLPGLKAPAALRIDPGISLSRRSPSMLNPRRVADLKGKRRFQPHSDEEPAAASHSMNRILVDGSPHFLAIRLPSNDETIQPLREILKRSGFMLEPSNRKWWLRDRHKTLNFLAEHWRSLKDHWRAVFTDNFEAKLERIKLSKLDVSASEKNGQFELDIRLSETQDDVDLRKAIATGKNYVTEEDGRITLLDRNSIERLHKIGRAVSGQVDRPFTPTFRKKLESAELVDVEDLLDEMCEGWQPPQAWQLRSRALKQVGALEPAPVRPAFDVILRTYQRIGVAWLWHLYRYELGGILADEMGLGKTLQGLALIECIRNSSSKAQPALVVCPASLVENWMREATRFTPDLKVLKHHGPRRARESVLLEDVDLVITSYGTLQQDSELMNTMDWCVVIGDEAQHIKNRRSRNAQALSHLRSKSRFLLTGTPVENSLDDLLSLFTFLMPGYLQKAQGKLMPEDRTWHNQRQTQRAAAYILRRTKKEVAPELPEKIEKTFFCEFGSEQRSFYQNVLERTRKEIFELEMSGTNKGRVQLAAFKELLRLRQACVDPRILDETFAANESAKLTAFDEILDQCLDNGSRILVFSSFVTALQLLAQHLKKKGHRFCYLDGQTRNRLAVCDTFNDDKEIPVFLISLKAGGAGLNLTGADTVLHYDPWWNPAAEAQATDRAHRIGQERVVTSIKLIAANTVEEKVLQLQAKKAQLLAELFEESAIANAKVSIDDIKNLLESSGF